MSRADAFHAFYRESRARLLVQVYAYAGDTELAQRALADAYVDAGHHWRKLVDSPGKDAWMRERAFRATGRVQNRARKPWYVRAQRTADEHRRMLQELQALAPADRTLLIVHLLAGLDLPSAAREAGITADAAAVSLRTSLEGLAAAGVVSTTFELRDRLAGLPHDLADEPVDRASWLRREGDRRRRANVVLAGLLSLAVVIGAGALTAARPQVPAPPETRQPTATAPPSKVAPAPAPAPDFDTSLLAPLTDVRRVVVPNPWRVRHTSADFGVAQPYDECVPAVPSDDRAEHFWVREFAAGRGRRATTATEALEVSRSADAAGRNRDRLVKMLTGCAAPHHQITGFHRLRGVGDGGNLVTMRYADRGVIHTRQVSIAQTGKAVLVWVVDAPTAEPVGGARLVSLTGLSAARLCELAVGRCGHRPYTAVAVPPPPVDRARGFLTTVDMPVFEGLRAPWVATAPNAARTNPAATECDRADFAGAGAKDLRARSLVVPAATKLATIFGMTETVGSFGSVGKAESFLTGVDSVVRRCDRQLSLSVESNVPIRVERGRGRIYEVALALSKTQTITFRIALVRIGTMVAQVTFTPTARFDLTAPEYEALIQRAALRVSQH
ncbi:MAG: hypothetical protein H0T17_02190 [Propionibacteriales bacterium]|nr:hypothetical protein [Propionibacteriales bacterium]